MLTNGTKRLSIVLKGEDSESLYSSDSVAPNQLKDLDSVLRVETFANWLKRNPNDLSGTDGFDPQYIW